MICPDTVGVEVPLFPSVASPRLPVEKPLPFFLVEVRTEGKHPRKRPCEATFTLPASTTENVSFLSPSLVETVSLQLLWPPIMIWARREVPAPSLTVSLSVFSLSEYFSSVFISSVTSSVISPGFIPSSPISSASLPLEIVSDMSVSFLRPTAAAACVSREPRIKLQRVLFRFAHGSSPFKRRTPVPRALEVFATGRHCALPHVSAPKRSAVPLLSLPLCRSVPSALAVFVESKVVSFVAFVASAGGLRKRGAKQVTLRDRDYVPSRGARRRVQGREGRERRKRRAEHGRGGTVHRQRRCMRGQGQELTRSLQRLLVISFFSSPRDLRCKLLLFRICLALLVFPPLLSSKLVLFLLLRLKPLNRGQRLSWRKNLLLLSTLSSCFCLGLAILVSLFLVSSAVTLPLSVAVRPTALLSVPPRFTAHRTCTFASSPCLSLSPFLLTLVFPSLLSPLAGSFSFLSFF